MTGALVVEGTDGSAPDPALVLELIRDRLAPGARVLATTATAYERDIAFGLVAAVIAEHLDLAGVDASLGAEVAPAAASVAGPAGAGVERVAASLRRRLVAVADPQGVALVVHDAQFTDPDSMAVLTELMTVPPHGALVVVAGPSGLLAGLDVDRAILEPGAMARPTMTADLARALTVAAILGPDAPAEIVAEVAGLSTAAVSRALAGVGLGGPDDPRNRAAARVALEGTGPATLAVLHGRAAAAWRARGVDPIAVAPHVARSAAVGDDAAIAVLLAAAVAGEEKGDVRSAAEWRQAAAVLVPQEQSGRRAELLLLAAHSLRDAGHFRASFDAADAGLRAVPTGAQVLRAALLAQWTQMAVRVGHLDLAVARRAELEAVADVGSPHQVAENTLALALVAFHSGDRSRLERWAAASARAAEVAGDSGIAAFAELLGSSEVQRVTPTAGDAPLAVRFADALAAVSLGRVTEACIGLGRLRACVGSLEDEGRAYELPILSLSVVVLTAAGRLTEAAEVAVAVEAVAVEDGSAQSLMNGHGAVALVALEQGHLAAARRAADLTWAAALAAGAGPLRAAPVVVVARVRAAMGDAEGAVAALIEGCGPGLELLTGWWAAVGFEVLVRHDAAERRATWARAACDRADGPLGEAVAVRLSATAGTVTDPSVVLAAVARMEVAGAFLEAARGRLVAAESLVRAGDREAAVALLQRAELAAADMGAEQVRAAAALALRELGGRSASRPARRTTVAGLTLRQAEVAELVADGLSNRTIAAALGISEKGVERHVGAVLAKLGVTARAGIGRALANASASRPTSAARPRHGIIAHP